MIKKALLIVLTILIVIAAIWCVFNLRKITIINDGMVKLPAVYLGTYDPDTGLYIANDGESAYGLCPDGESCKGYYPPYYTGDYHKFYPSGEKGEFLPESNHDCLELIISNNKIYKEAIDLESDLNHLENKYRIHEKSKPELPDFPAFNDYVTGNGDALAEIVNFFKWFGNVFKFIFKLITWVFEIIIYYIEYVKILIEVFTI